MNCADNQKVNFVLFMLVGEDKCWWNSTGRLLEGGIIISTWEIFKIIFLEKYFPNDMCEESKRNKVYAIETRKYGSRRICFQDLRIRK